MTIVVLQGLLFALTYQPTILDEARHLGVIDIYTNTLNPFIRYQDASFDWLGDITRDPSMFYYYALSYPLRFIQFFTDNWKLQVISLRLIHLVAFTLGIYVYDRMFSKMGFPILISRLTLLFLILTPSVAVLPGVVNYDNFIFLFSGLLLLYTVKIFKSKKVQVETLLTTINIVLFGTLIKYTFLALALPVCVFIIMNLMRRKLFNKRYFVIKKNAGLVFMMALFIVGLGLFIERPMNNFIMFGRFNGDCVSLHGENRCLKNYVQARNIRAVEVMQDDFKPKNFYKFIVSDWVPNIIVTQVRLTPWSQPSKVLHGLYFASFFGGLALILIQLKQIVRSSRYTLFVLYTVTTFCIILAVTIYQAYVSLGEVVAASSRYLLPVQPLFMILVAFSGFLLVGDRRSNRFKIALISTFLMLLLLISMGGVVSYIRTAPKGQKWTHYTN